VAIEFHIDDAPAGPDTHVVEVAGEVDLFTAPEFRARIAAPIEAGCTRVIVDLSEVTFIDSSSLGVLIDAHKRLEQDDRRLVIVCSDRAILSTFRITGLDGIFTIVGSREDAVAAP